MSYRARRYNARNAALIPAGGEVAYPQLYRTPRDHFAFYQETKRFQRWVGLKVDGYFGPATMAAFLEEFVPPPSEIEEDAETKFSLRLWVGWGRVTEAEVRWIAALGVDTVILNVNSAGASGSWAWDKVPGAIGEQVALFRSYGIRVLLMPWMWRTHAFNRVAYKKVLHLARESMADGVQFDVEGSWVFTGRTPGLSYDGVVQDVWRPYWIERAQDEGLTVHPTADGKPPTLALEGRPFVYESTPLYFPRGAVDALNDEPEITAVSPQAYSIFDTRNTKKAASTRSKGFRAPTLQQRTLQNYLPKRKRGDFAQVYVGIGLWWLDHPYATVLETMTSAVEASHKGGANGVCGWGLHTVQPGSGPDWRREAEHREALETVSDLIRTWTAA